MQVLSRGFLMSTMLTNPKQKSVLFKKWLNYPKAPRNTDATSLDPSSCIRFRILLVASGWELFSKVWNRSNFWTNNSQHFFYSVPAKGLRNNVGSVCTALPTLGSFSIDDGNGSENVTFKKKFPFFKHCRVYSNLLKMANVGEFPRSWFLEERTQLYRAKKKFVVACLGPP